MHPADINAALIKRGYNQTRIADILDVRQCHVSHVIYGRIKSNRVAAAIAAAIDTPISQIWPGVYDAPRGGRPRAAA